VYRKLLHIKLHCIRKYRLDNILITMRDFFIAITYVDYSVDVVFLLIGCITKTYFRKVTIPV